MSGMRFYTIAGAAKFKGVTESTIRRWIASGQLAPRMADNGANGLVLLDKEQLTQFQPRTAGNPTLRTQGKAPQGKAVAVVKAPLKHAPKPIETPATIVPEPTAPLPRIKYSAEPTTPPSAGYERIKRSACGHFEWVDRPIKR